MSRLYAVAYDIVDDACRTRVAQVLEGYGNRVQWSVFECLLDPAQLAELRARLLSEIDSQEDSVRFYPLCARCRQRVVWHGKPRPEPPGGFFLV
jgi:CRISPR-associated protein Cas2